MSDPPMEPAALVSANFAQGATRISGQEPSYSKDAMKEGVQGTLLAKCVLFEDGTLHDCCVMRGLPFMNEAVIDALYTWRYTPFIFQGHPIKVELTIPVQLKPPSGPPVEPAPAATTASSPSTSPAPFPFGAGMERPKRLTSVPPRYNLEAAKQRIQGTMLLKCTITVDGSVTNCRVIKGLPYMNEPVVAAVEQWKYTPVLFQGRPVAVDYNITIHIVAPEPTPSAGKLIPPAP